MPLLNLGKSRGNLISPLPNCIVTGTQTRVVNLYLYLVCHYCSKHRVKVHWKCFHIVMLLKLSVHAWTQCSKLGRNITWTAAEERLAFELLRFVLLLRGTPHTPGGFLNCRLGLKSVSTNASRHLLDANIYSWPVDLVDPCGGRDWLHHLSAANICSPLTEVPILPTADKRHPDPSG